MKTRIRSLIVLLISVFLFSCSLGKHGIQSVSIDRYWKFRTGDDPSWSWPGFDDSKWDSINVEKYWEDQGYECYDGYAWYRTKVIIPSSLRNHSYLKDSLQFFLGRIDNCDQFYLNGQFVGENNNRVGTPGSGPVFERAGSYHTSRNYILPVSDSRIQWDKENVLAVRVFDRGGDGGFRGSHPHISMLDMKDRLIIDKSGDHFKNSCDTVSKVWKDKEAFTRDIKQTYNAPTKEAAKAALKDFVHQWEDE